MSLKLLVNFTSFLFVQCSIAFIKKSEFLSDCNESVLFVYESNYKGNTDPAAGRFKRNILPVIGNYQIIELNNAAIQKVINTAYLERNLAKKTLMNIQSDLSSFLKFCRKNEITQFRVEDIDIPKSAKRSQKQILQPDDMKKLFTIDTTLRYKKRILEPYVYGWRLQVLCALRPGEVGGLRKSDRYGNVIHLQHSINVYKVETQGKNEKQRQSRSHASPCLFLLGHAL